MTDFGMFTNEGNLAVAERLTQITDPDLTAAEQYARFRDLCETDQEFCAQHGEWSDTAAREAVYSWLDAPEALTVTEKVGGVEFGATIFIKVPTLDGDADAVLTKRLNEIRDIIQEAIEEAMSELDKRIGNTSGQEWSGLDIRVI